MTNENLIIEMLQNITKGMDEMKQELKAEMAEMKQELSEVKSTVNSLGEMFEHTVKLKQDSDEQLSNTLKYLVDKVFEHDMAIHTLRNKQ